jgi:formylglycine-generating enzyme required for sulfatase activity
MRRSADTPLKASNKRLCDFAHLGAALIGGLLLATTNPNSSAWYSYNFGKKTREVGRKQPNAFGLYDMHGNVWEWVEDCFNETYSGAPTDGSPVTSGDCSLRMLRGGSWADNTDALRSAFRGRSGYGPRDDAYGFRIKRVLDTSP